MHKEKSTLNIQNVDSEHWIWGQSLSNGVEVVPFEVEMNLKLNPFLGWVHLGLSPSRDRVLSGLNPFGVETILDWVPRKLSPFAVEFIWGSVHSGLSPFAVESIWGWVHTGSSPFGVESIWGWVHSEVRSNGGWVFLGSVILGFSQWMWCQKLYNSVDSKMLINSHTDLYCITGTYKN